MDLFGDRTEDIVKLAQLETQKAQEKARQEEMAKRIDYYYDLQLDYLNSDLKAQFVHYEELKLQSTFRNIVKRVVDKISLLYNTAPSRVLLQKNGKVDEKKTQLLQEEIWEKANLNNICSTTEKLMNLCRTCAVKVGWRNGLVYDIYTPDGLSVVQNQVDITVPDAVIYKRKLRTDTVSGDEKYELIMWTPERHFILQDSGRYLKQVAIDGNPDMINPYGVIPFAWFRYDVNWRTFWNEGGDDLINAQEDVNVKLTELNQLIKMQSFSVPVMIGFEGKEPQVIDPTSPLCIPVGIDQGDFKFVSPDAKIMDVWKTITNQINGIATDYDIAPGSFQLTGSVRSGLELKLENVGLYERAWKKKSYAIAFENQLWELSKIVYETQTKNKLPEGSLVTTFDSVNIPEDPEKELKVWKEKFRWGLKSPIDYIMHKDPTLSKKEAEELYMTNLKYQEELKGKFPSLKALFEKQEKGSAE